MAETYSGEFYCVKCKEKREAEGNVVVDERPPHGQGQVPRLRHEPQPHPRQGLTLAASRPPARFAGGAVAAWTPSRSPATRGPVDGAPACRGPRLARMAGLGGSSGGESGRR